MDLSAHLQQLQCRSQALALSPTPLFPVLPGVCHPERLVTTLHAPIPKSPLEAWPQMLGYLLLQECPHSCICVEVPAWALGWSLENQASGLLVWKVGCAKAFRHQL